MTDTLHKAMDYLAGEAKKEGKSQRQFALDMLASTYGVHGERLGKLLDDFGDPLEGLAFIMLEDIKRDRTKKAEAEANG